MISDDHFSQSTAGFIVPMITGLLSAFSSAIILNIIRLSPDKLSTTYHRLMASMSMFDFIASICIALVTLPMPSDNVLDFSGPMLGNRWTCQIQGYFITFGMGGGVTLYMCLSWYFVLSISFKMKQSTIKKRVEPIMFAYALFVAFFIPSYLAVRDQFQPIIHSAFCTISYPLQSQEGCDDDTCQDEYGSYKVSLLYIGCWILVNLLLIFVAMIIILFTFYRSAVGIEKAILEAVYGDSPSDLISELRSSRSSMVQALMYIFASVLTWLFMIIRYFDAKYYTDVGVSVFFPLQGFWNMAIFVYDKAHLVYHSEVCDSWCDAIKTVFVTADQIPSILLKMNIVEDDIVLQSNEQGLNDMVSSASALKSYNPSKGEDESMNAIQNQSHMRTIDCVAVPMKPTLARYPFFKSKDKVCN